MTRTMMMGVLGAILTMAPSQAEAGPRVHVSINAPIPAPVVVVPAPTRAPARIWVPDQVVWDARMRRNVVIPGHWQVAPRAAATWVPGHWERRGRNGRVWVEGYWAR